MSEASKTSTAGGGGAFERYLRARIERTGGGSWLDAYPIGSVVPFVEACGVAAQEGVRQSKLGPDRSEAAAAREIGFALVGETPQGFWQVLDRLIVGRPQPTGPTDAYGWVFNWLSQRKSDGLAIEALKILAAHARKYRLIAPTEELVNAPAAETISMVDAARRLGMQVDRAKHFLQAHGLVPEGSRRGVTFHLPRQAVLELCATRKHSVNLLGLARMLKIGKPSAYKLVKHGHFTPMKGCMRGGRKLFPIAEVEAWLAKLAPEVSEADLEWVPLPRACHIAQTSHTRVVSAALAGEIRTSRIEGEGLAGVGVLLQEAWRYTNNSRCWKNANR